MALPSIQNLVQDIKYVLLRFPLEILFAIIGTTAALISIKNGYPDNAVSNWYTRLILTANLGFLFSLSASLYLENKAVKGLQLYLFKVPVALLASCLIFVLNPFERSDDYLRFLLLSLAGHLLVSFSAYIHADSIQGFWQFNKTIFIRFLTAMLDSGVLYLGLAAALGAIKFLFNLDIGSKSYTTLFALIAGIFSTTFFLAGIPKDLDTLNEDFTYPKGLKIFTQYVLIPLATIYVMILLAYEVKILIEWNLPKGLVSNLILGYAVFGILALLMIFPIRDHEENRWIKTYARSFYFLMLPLIVLLFLAVGTRVFRYGITESRYFLIMLAVWLLMVTVYSLLSRKQNIKLIPISLCLFTLFSIYGPQSAFSVSEYSQIKILTKIFKRNNAFKDHKMIVPKDISVKDGNQAARTLRYIVENYNYSALQSYVNVDLHHVADSLAKTKEITKSNAYSLKYDLGNLKIKWLQNHLGLRRFSSSNFKDEATIQYVQNDECFFEDSESDLMDIEGYDLLLDATSQETMEITANGKINAKKSIKSNGMLTLQLNNDSTSFNVKALLNGLIKNPEQLENYKKTDGNASANDYSLPSAKLSLTRETKNFRVTYKIKYIRFERGKDKSIKAITFQTGIFLIKLK